MHTPKQSSESDIEQLEDKCPSCGESKYMNYKYDAIFCLKENKWLESGCQDPECEFCNNRPDKPI